jgi:tRNA dimethylallyltransferase
MSLIIICGATATGKSELALLVAKELDAQIVNADSMQVYRGMDLWQRGKKSLTTYWTCLK